MSASMSMSILPRFCTHSHTHAGTLGRSWGGLGRSWGDLGGFLEGPGAFLVGLGETLGGSWGDLGRSWGAMREPGGPKSIGKRTISCAITFSKLRRFEDGFGTNIGRPGRQKERNGPPTWTQDRPQEDPKPTSKSS